MTNQPSSLMDRFLDGEPLALSRCISLVENQSPEAEALLLSLHDRIGSARRLGITGPPGAGKSTLTSALARLYRDAGETVGVIAVDPSSPFTGGALLGDRVRMDDLATEEGIFIRSMASRGSRGGLAATTREVTDLMDAFGFDRIILETVGVGQSELAIAMQADTTMVVLVPESGDGIQAMKAGLMEVADLFVVNKADRPGADRLKKEIQVVRGLRTRRDASGWDASVMMTVASEGDGVPAVAEALDQHFEWMKETGTLQTRRIAAAAEHARLLLERAVRRRGVAAWNEWITEVGPDAGLSSGSPYEIARRLAHRACPDVDERRKSAAD